MSKRYVCDSCGHRGVDRYADTADEILCEMCGEPVLEDLDVEARPERDDPRGRDRR